MQQHADWLTHQNEATDGQEICHETKPKMWIHKKNLLMKEEYLSWIWE